MLPKVAAIHDLCGFGHSSLAAVLPILSIMGIQVCSMPTAVLSTQTDGYDHYSFVDLTSSLPAFINHWQRLAPRFDGIYSGFLSSETQIDLVEGFIDEFKKENTLVLIDPVLGDNGYLYETMNQTMVQKMRQLIQKADIITPNLTELCLLMATPFASDLSDETIKKYLRHLALTGPEVVLVTSVPMIETSADRIIAYERRENRYTEILCHHLPASYCGTGDIFASVLLGGLLQALPLATAIQQAADFVHDAIAFSLENYIPAREGVQLEAVLSKLCTIH